MSAVSAQYVPLEHWFIENLHIKIISHSIAIIRGMTTDKNVIIVINIRRE